jgi:rhamnogalacturonan endolyase
MSRWGGTYTVGSSKASDFPMAIFAKTGGTGNVVFDLSAAQAGAALTLRVGTTLSFKGGRPLPKIGSWTGATPKVPKDLNSRGITRGGYRGHGEIYDFPIPAGTLKAGKHTLSLGVAGSGDEGYLSANYIVDAVELIEGRH